MRLPISLRLNFKLLNLAGDALCNMATAHLTSDSYSTPKNRLYDLVVLPDIPQTLEQPGELVKHISVQAMSPTRTSGGGYPSF